MKMEKARRACISWSTPGRGRRIRQHHPASGEGVDHSKGAPTGLCNCQCNYVSESIVIRSA